MTDVGASQRRVLLVGRGPPDRGGISAFLQALLASPLPGCEVSVLNLAREQPTRSGRLTRPNVTRTMADARAVWRASRHSDLVHIHTALAPHVTMIRAGVL